MMPRPFSEEGAAEKHMPQLQHNMRVTNTKLSALSIITGGGKWVEISIAVDPLYQYLLLKHKRNSDTRRSPLASSVLSRSDRGLRPSGLSEKRSQSSQRIRNDFLQAN